MKQAIVLSTHSAQFNAVAFKGDLETNIAKIARWGYDGVELAIRDPQLVDAGELEGNFRSNGLEMPAIGTGQAWGEERLSFSSSDAKVRAAAVERIQSHIPLAARFHAVIILGLIRGVTPAGQSHAQSMRYLVECIRDCAAAGASSGVRFALEPINRYETDLINTVGEGMELLEKVGEDNFGLLLDTFHMNVEEPRIEESIRTCGERIFHFHVADSNRWYPGAGHLDFKAIFAALAGTGYRGYISGEFLPKPDADTAAVQNRRHLTQLLNKG